MKQEKNMRYIIADIHGCYNEYINLLKKIKLVPLLWPTSVIPCAANALRL